MLYPNDFKHHKFYKTQLKILKYHSIKSKKSFIQNYCLQTTLHGLRYIADDNIRGYKKKIWILVFILAIIGTIYSLIEFKLKSDRSQLTNVLENTSYPVYMITFPAITICNYNRINWLKINNASIQFLPSNSPKELIEMFKDFASTLEDLSFGNFEIYDRFNNISLEDLDFINLENLSYYLSHNRDDIFETCWYINDYVLCNETFGQQKSESGNCFTFNSVLTERGQLRAISESYFPVRVSTEGPGSGLKIQIKLKPELKRRGNNQRDGILVIIHNIAEWPSRTFFVPVNSERQIILNPILYNSDPETKSLSPEIRQCFFSDEHDNPKYTTLPGQKYLYGNCLSQCRQMHLIKFCGCSMGMFYPLGNYKPCNASDMKCLAKYDKVFSNVRNSETNYYVRSTGEGLICDCIDDCYTLLYNYEVRSIRELESNRIILDIYYLRSKMLQYQTYLVYGWLDWLVYYGGIFSLFLGCSLISFAELIYFMFVEIVSFFSEIKVSGICMRNKFKSKNGVKKVLPINNRNLNNI